MPNFNPFASDNEETSFEQGAPISQAAKNAAKTASAQTDDQVQKANQAIVDQLYGPSSPTGQEQGTDEANPSHADTTNAATRAVTAHAGGNKSSNMNQNSNQTPEEQVKMERIRHELFANYSSKFKSAQNGAHGLVTDLEQEMEKARREREQKETQRKQDEEEEERRKKEEEEQQNQEFVMPAGKKTGMMFGKKQQQPIAVQMAKTKTEINRGASG